MSQEKAQLIAPIGIMTVSGMTATGVITATSFTGNVVGSAKSLVNGTDVTAGVVTATSFAGNLTGNIQRLADSAPDISAGVTTASSFVGNLTGSVTDLTSQPAITVGLVTATSLSGPITGNVTGDVVGDVTGNVTGTISGNVTGNVTGNATGNAGGLGVNYNGGWTGAGTSQVRVGVITATTFYGDGSNLEGISSGPVSQQSIGITSATTTIDLSNGNLIYATQSADTTVSFASTANGNVYFIRVKDETDTARSITWPDRINWDGGFAPTLIDLNSADEAQVFLLVTRDMGVTWYGKEIFNLGSNFYTLFTVGYDADGGGGRVTRNVHVSSPVQLGGSKWKPTNTWGKNYALNTKFDGTLWSWGHNENGNGGFNDRANRSSPTQVGGDSDGWSACSASYQRVSLATKTNGTLWSWGYNNAGELGHNDRANRSSPTQLPGTDWSAGESKIISGIIGAAIKTNGTLWIWGNNSNGALGLNQTAPSTRYSSPVQVGTDTTWSKIFSGGEGTHRFAIKTDGTLWVWGYGAGGRLGLNQTDNNNRSSPTQVGTDTTWTEAMSSMNSSLGIKTNGTLWAWGEASYGQLGQNSSNVALSSPTQVGTDTTWSKLGTGRYASFATKTDGTLWSWGWNGDSGALGHNEANTSYSSPKQVPGTNWVDITSNGQFGPLGWYSS